MEPVGQLLLTEIGTYHFLPVVHRKVEFVGSVLTERIQNALQDRHVPNGYQRFGQDPGVGIQPGPLPSRHDNHGNPLEGVPSFLVLLIKNL